MSYEERVIYDGDEAGYGALRVGIEGRYVELHAKDHHSDSLWLDPEKAQAVARALVEAAALAEASAGRRT